MKPQQPTIAPVLGANQALELMARASEILSASLDYQQTLRRVAGLAVPEVADWCGVYLIEEDGSESEITSGYADPELDAFLTEVRRARRERADASESRRVAQTQKAILASDIRQVDSGEFDEAQRELASRLAAKSYMLVPLLARGRSLGSLTLLSTREGRHYGEDDLSFAMALAARCALAIDNARLHEAAERSLRQLDAIFATAPVGLAFVDRDLRFVRINEELAAANGLPVESHVGETILEVLGDAAQETAETVLEVLRTGQPIRNRELQPPGSRRGHWMVSYAPVRNAEDDIVGVTLVAVDVTERRRLLEAEREARRRADFLAHAGSLLDESLDYEETLRAVAQIAIPEVADWCTVSILDDRGLLRQVAAAHSDPAQLRLSEELNRRFPPDPVSMSGTMRVVRTGRIEVVREITDDMLVTGVEDPEQLALVRALGLRSVIVAPLQARGKTRGTLMLAQTESGRLFDEDDVQLADELARRAGIAIDNARLYTERTHIAHTLQVKLLPERLPEIPGVALAARYRAAGELNEVGGDFYDVLQRSPHEWAMVVGDVSGKGPEAAALTALARYTLRAVIPSCDRPAEALQQLNSAILAHEDLSRLATAVLAYASLDGPDMLRVRLALAGHLPPLVLRADASVERVGALGTMLGLRPDPELHDTEVHLRPGDVLLLYTDGVTDAGPRERPFGESGLMALVSDLGERSPDAVLDVIARATLPAQDEQPRDDIALLAIALRASD